MNLRESISQRPMLGKGVAVVFVMLAAAFVYVQVRSPAASSYASTKAFFSSDDGKTWFTDSSTRIPPFDKDGKQAVRAYVYHCGDGPPFVGYLERFTPEAKQFLEQNQSQNSGQKSADPAQLRNAYTAGREVKHPGDSQWTSGAHPVNALQITMVKCPNGTGTPESVDP